MTLPSDQLTIELPDSNGKIVRYYTYDGYLQEHDRHTLRDTKRNFEQLRYTGAALFGFLGFALTRRLALPVLSIKGYSVPTAGLFSGVVAAGIGQTVASLYGNLRLPSLERELIQASKHLPLWSNPRYAVNPDRAYFELADERHNEPLVFHSGLTPEASANLIPDKIIGSVPHRPHAPSAHGHAHH